jgi:hypothetical protein
MEIDNETLQKLKQIHHVRRNNLHTSLNENLFTTNRKGFTLPTFNFGPDTVLNAIKKLTFIPTIQTRQTQISFVAFNQMNPLHPRNRQLTQKAYLSKFITCLEAIE